LEEGKVLVWKMSENSLNDIVPENAKVVSKEESRQGGTCYCPMKWIPAEDCKNIQESSLLTFFSENIFTKAFVFGNEV
jgi:hypothetical protein